MLPLPSHRFPRRHDRLRALGLARCRGGYTPVPCASVRLPGAHREHVEVYGKGSRLPFSEDDDVVLGATSRIRWAYAASKMVDEFLGLAYGASTNYQSLSSDSSTRLVPARRAATGWSSRASCAKRTAASPSRSTATAPRAAVFVDVADVVRALIGLAEHPDALGGCAAETVRQL